MEKSKLHKISSIFEWILIGIICFLLAFVLIFASKPTGNSSGSLFGYETRLVLSDSMNASDDFYEGKDYKIESFKAGDAIIISDVDYQDEDEKLSFFANLSVGDVVTYQSLNYHAVITHRIINIDVIEQDNEITDYKYTVQGDNVESSDYSSEIISMSGGLIIGKVVKKSSFVGWVYNSFISNKALVYTIVIIPCLAGVIFESIKIAKIVKDSKKENETAEAEMIVNEKDKEIEELKKQIESLKNSSKSTKTNKTEEDKE